MQLSHSRVECFESCPYKYKLRYLDKLQTIKDYKPNNALFLGTALHTGLEKGVEAAIREYYMQYPVITDEHVNEAIKLEIMINKAKNICPDGLNEVEISDKDFKGYIDLLAPVQSDTKLSGKYQRLPNLFDIYDFKYSNNANYYKDSVQIHLYKYFYEKLNPGKKIRKLFYLVVPKLNIERTKNESLSEFRNRIYKECFELEPQLVEIEYDPNKVVDWCFNVKNILECNEFERNRSWLCRYCDYKLYCESNEKIDYEIIYPKERG